MSETSKRLQSLHDAVKSNNLEQVKALLDGGVNPNEIDVINKPPVLFYACEQHNLEMVKLLITHPHRPANPNIRGKWGCEKYGRKYEYLIMYIIDHYGAHYEKIELTTLLLKEALIDVNVDTKRHGTPLINAVFHNNMEMVELLLSAGADINHATSFLVVFPKTLYFLCVCVIYEF